MVLGTSNLSNSITQAAAKEGAVNDLQFSNATLPDILISNHSNPFLAVLTKVDVSAILF